MQNLVNNWCFSLTSMEDTFTMKLDKRFHQHFAKRVQNAQCSSSDVEKAWKNDGSPLRNLNYRRNLKSANYLALQHHLVIVSQMRFGNPKVKYLWLQMALSSSVEFCNSRLIRQCLSVFSRELCLMPCSVRLYSRQFPRCCLCRQDWFSHGRLSCFPHILWHRHGAVATRRWKVPIAHPQPQ